MFAAWFFGADIPLWLALWLWLAVGLIVGHVAYFLLLAVLYWRYSK